MELDFRTKTRRIILLYELKRRFECGPRFRVHDSI